MDFVDRLTYLMNKPENTYSFKKGDGKEYVIHNESGTTIPYHSYKPGYEAHKKMYPDFLWKYEFFRDYFLLGKQGRKKLKEEWNRAQKNKEQDMKLTGCAKAAPAPLPLKGCSAQTGRYVIAMEVLGNYYYTHYNTGDVAITPVNKEEETMTKSDDMIKIDYLTTRLNQIYRDKGKELRKQFNLDDDDRPSSAKEFFERIKSGKYVLPKSYLNEKDEPASSEDEDFDENYFDYYDFMYSIRWRDPAKKEDKKGFKLADEKLNKLFASTKDAIMVKSPEEGLKALEDFKSATFQ